MNELSFSLSLTLSATLWTMSLLKKKEWLAFIWSGCSEIAVFLLPDRPYAQNENKKFGVLFRKARPIRQSLE